MTPHSFGRTAARLAAAAAAGAVVLFSQGFATCFPAPKLAILASLAPLAAVALVAAGRAGVPWRGPLCAPLVAVGLAALLDFARSPAPEAGALLLAPIAGAIGLAWITAALAGDPRIHGRMLASICAMHLACAAYGILQITGRDPWTWTLDYGRGRIFATLGNPNFLAGQFALLLPVFAALGITARTLPLRWLARAAFTAGLLAFTAAQTRGAWLGLAAGLAVAGGGWLFLHGRSITLERWRWLPIAAGLVLLPYALPALNPTEVSLPRQLGSSFEVDQQSARQRFFWWTAAGYLIRASPVTGHGLGGFVREFPARQRRAAPRYADLPPAFCNHPHQDYLFVAAEHGILGLGLLLWLGAVWLRLDWNGMRRGNLQSAGSLAGVVALAIHALFNMPSLIEATLATAGLLLGLDSGAAPGRRTAPAPPEPFPDADEAPDEGSPAPASRFPVLVLAIGLPLALALAVRPATLLMAQAYLNGGRILIDQQVYGPGAFLVRQSLRISQAPWRARFLLGSALYAQGYWKEARDAFRADEAENPWGADAILHAAKTLRQEGRHAAADAEARRALAVVPNYAEAALTLATVAYANAEDALKAGKTADQKHHLHRARVWTNYALGFFPRHPEAWRLAGFIAVRDGRWLDARDAWRNSLRARPTDDRLRRSLEWLEADLPRLLKGGKIRVAPG